MGLITLPAGATVVDFSFTPPDPCQVKDEGYQAIVGYLPWDPDTIERGCLHHALIESYMAQGLAWSCCWELNAERALAGFATGIADGNSAGVSARGLGAAPGSVVHCVVDFDAVPATIVDYCVGFAEAVSGFGFTPGGYGSGAVVDHLMAGARVRSGWQTEAWSHGIVSPYAHLLQRANYKPIDATDHNDLLKPMPFTSGSTGGSPMFTTEEERKLVEVLTYPYEPFGRAALLAEVIAAVNANAGRIETLTARLNVIDSKLDAVDVHLDSADLQRAEVKALLHGIEGAVKQLAGQTQGTGASALDIARALIALLAGGRISTPSPAPASTPGALMNRPFAAADRPGVVPDQPSGEELAAAVAGIEMLARSQRRVAPPMGDTPT